MSNKKEIDSLDNCLLKINDDKGRVNIPSEIRDILNIAVGSLIELNYLECDSDDKNKSLLPFKERNHVRDQFRYQTSQLTREYLGLGPGDYFTADIKKIS